MAAVIGTSTDLNAAVSGQNTSKVFPTEHAPKTTGAAVVGQAEAGHGVVGISNSSGDVGVGVYGTSPLIGVMGESGNGIGVAGFATGVNGKGVQGQGGANGDGVAGNTVSDTAAGVRGQNSGGGDGVVGQCEHSAGVRGISTHGTGIVGEGGTFAAQFVGTVQVQGDMTLSGDIFLSGADYAEALSTTDPGVGAGTVVVLGDDGEVHPCARDYDTAVAGIVSGAGGVKPAIVLDRHQGSAHVALMGKVWCHANADPAPIRPGDLLTTSMTTGHCRRVTDPTRAFGAVIGKALTPLESGRGLVRVLVSPR